MVANRVGQDRSHAYYPEPDRNSGCTPRAHEERAHWAFSLKKQHCKAMTISGLADFEPYVLRHSCLTSWAKWMDPYNLHKLAGHSDMSTGAMSTLTRCSRPGRNSVSILSANRQKWDSHATSDHVIN